MNAGLFWRVSKTPTETKAGANARRANRLRIAKNGRKAAGQVLEKILAPMVIGKEFEKAENFWDLMKSVRGNRMAKAAIETAVWDLEAKKLNVPLWKHLGGVNREISCGVSIGIQDSVEQLFEKIQTELDAGYQRIKIKIAPHWDYDVIKRVREKFGDILLMGDANSAYTLDDIDKLKSLDEFDLMMLEQPLCRTTTLLTTRNYSAKSKRRFVSMNRFVRPTTREKPLN